LNTARQTGRPDASARNGRLDRRFGQLAAAALATVLATILGACDQGPAPPPASAASRGTASSTDARPGARNPGRQRVHLVELAVVAEKTLREEATYTGSLRYRRTVRVFSREAGIVAELPWYEGDRVTAGTTLFRLDTRLLEAEVRKAEAVLGEARANVKRTRRLLARRMVSEEEHLRARTALEVAKAERSVLVTRLGFTRAAAPFDALVTERLAEPGDVVERQTHLLTLADPGSLVIDLEVSESIVPHLRRGAPATVRIDALGGQRYDGKVARIYPELNPRTRQGRVEVTLEPLPAGARAGLFTRVTFEISALNRRAIPFAALRRDREVEYVFRVGADGKARKTVVRSGRRSGGEVEVLEGLTPGDRVVVRGFLGLGDGKPVVSIGDGQGGRG